MNSLLTNINRLLPKKIWQQIFYLLISLVIIPLIVLGILLLKNSEKAIKTSIKQDHEEIARLATGEISEHIQGARQILHATAAILGRLHADIWRIETTLVELSLTNSAFQRISFINKKGFEEATSKLGSDLIFRGHEDGFKYAIEGSPYLSPLKASEKYVPFLTLAEPVRKMGQVEGVLIAELNLRSLWTIVDRIQIGQAGVAYLIDQEGRIVAHHDKKVVFEKGNLKNSEIKKNITEGRSGNFLETNHNGERFLLSYAPVKDLGWGLIISQPEKEAYYFLKKMKTQFYLIIAFSVLATIIISFMLARYMSQPMRQMIQGAERLTKGDFSTQFRIKHRNEIGKLLHTFNRVSRQLKKAQEEEKLSIIGKASTAIAHELKNSLQLIDTFVKELPRRHQDKKFLEQFSATMPKELDAWNNSLRNMMAFSQNKSFKIQYVSVNQILHDVIAFAQLRVKQLDISLEISLDYNIPLIHGNEKKLRQVFLNLITNALEATPSKGTITISTYQRDNEWVNIEISNNVADMNSDNLKRIFDPFYSTRSGGLGLGLSISKEIIERHQGRIKAILTASEKITFLINLPHNKSLLVLDDPTQKKVEKG
jgi:signal transduction histidine kinase